MYYLDSPLQRHHWHRSVGPNEHFVRKLSAILKPLFNLNTNFFNPDTATSAATVLGLVLVLLSTIIISPQLMPRPPSNQSLLLLRPSFSNNLSPTMYLV
jgi:hypothetical protein